MYEPNAAHQRWLDEFLTAFDAVAGSVHEQRGEDLFLTAAKNLPPPVISVVVHVPRGKGMAGQAQVRKAPVQTCDLQTDNTGAVKPGAKAVNAHAGIAVHVMSSAGDVLAVVGAAWMTEGDISPDRGQAIMRAASSLPISAPNIH